MCCTYTFHMRFYIFSVRSVSVRSERCQNVRTETDVSFITRSLEIVSTTKRNGRPHTVSGSAFLMRLFEFTDTAGRDRPRVVIYADHAPVSIVRRRTGRFFAAEFVNRRQFFRARKRDGFTGLSYSFSPSPHLRPFASPPWPTARKGDFSCRIRVGVLPSSSVDTTEVPGNGFIRTKSSRNTLLEMCT